MRRGILRESLHASRQATGRLLEGQGERGRRELDHGSRAHWQKRLWFTGIDNPTRKNMIAFENEMMDAQAKGENDFVSNALDKNDSRGHLTGEDIVRSLIEQLSDFNSENRERMHFYFERIQGSGRDSAFDRSGLKKKKKSAAKLAAQSDERREQLLKSIDLAFKGVSSIPDRMVENIRGKLQRDLTTDADTQGVLRSILQDEIDELDPDDREGMKDALKNIWGKVRTDLQRVMRTETVNAYSRVQLQEWYDSGIRQVTRHSIDDAVTCAICRGLSRPPDNVYNISELLKLDYPVTQDPRNGDWLTHPNCRCLVSSRAKIYTVEGWKSIKDIKVGDLVLTHKGKFKKVTALKNQAQWPKGGEVVKLGFEYVWRKGRYGIRKWEVDVTFDHPFLADTGWKLAKDIVVDDKIKTLARKCKHCGQLYPWSPQLADSARFCSSECALASDWERPKRHEIQRRRALEQVAREDRKNKWSEEKKRMVTSAGRKVLEQRIEDGTFHLQRGNRTWISWEQKPRSETVEIRAKISKTKIETGQNARACAACGGTRSKGERVLYEKVKELFSDAKCSESLKTSAGSNFVLDILLPDHKINIEYDGSYWHRDTQEKDARRDKELNEDGYTVLRAKEGEPFEPVIEQLQRLVANHEGKYEFMWLSPVKVETYKLKSARRLYNLEVEGDHSYIVAGIVSHNCWFEPIIEDVWKDIEDMEIELYGDATRKGTTALDIPIDDRSHVEKMLREMDEKLVTQFVPKIEELPGWKAWRLNWLISQGEPPRRAEIKVDDETFFGTTMEWTDPETQIHYIARDAKSLDHVTMPMARAQAEVKWDKADKSWVESRFDDLKAESEMTLEEEGIEIFGGQPFLSHAASTSPRDYFIESYAHYMVKPVILQSLDLEFYDWLRKDVFYGREYIERGGIK